MGGKVVKDGTLLRQGVVRLQQFDHRRVPVPCGPLQRRPSEGVLGVGVDALLVEQQLEYRFVPDLCGPRQRRPSEGVLGVDVDALLVE